MNWSLISQHTCSWSHSAPWWTAVFQFGPPPWPTSAARAWQWAWSTEVDIRSDSVLPRSCSNMRSTKLFWATLLGCNKDPRLFARDVTPPLLDLFSNFRFKSGHTLLLNIEVHPGVGGGSRVTRQQKLSYHTSQMNNTLSQSCRFVGSFFSIPCLAVVRPALIQLLAKLR